MPTTTKPLYITDRNECHDTYLGQFTDEDDARLTTYDLYAVLRDPPPNAHHRRRPRKHLDTLIARYGNEPKDYVSGYEFALANPYTPALSTAFIRLLKLDLIEPPQITLAQDLPSTLDDFQREVDELIHQLIFYIEDPPKDLAHHHRAAQAYLNLASYSLKLASGYHPTNQPLATQENAR